MAAVAKPTTAAPNGGPGPPAPAPLPAKHEFLRVCDVLAVGGARATVALHVTVRPASDAFDLLLIDGISAYRAEGAWLSISWGAAAACSFSFCLSAPLGRALSRHHQN